MGILSLLKELEERAWGPIFFILHWSNGIIEFLTEYYNFAEQMYCEVKHMEKPNCSAPQYSKNSCNRNSIKQIYAIRTFRG